MKFYFCNGCGKRITDKDVTRGEARDKKLKGVFCSDCAVGITTMDNVPLTEAAAKRLLGKTSSDTGRSASPAAANFYFCEKCGSRLTDKDIKHGQAMDKKLKGVYCVGCAEGVLTMEFEGLTSDEARRLVASDKKLEPAARGRSAGRRSSRSRMQAGEQRDARTDRGSGREQAAKPGSGSVVPIIVGVGAALFVVVLALVLFTGGNQKETQKTAKSGQKNNSRKSTKKAPRGTEPKTPVGTEPPASPGGSTEPKAGTATQPVSNVTQPVSKDDSPASVTKPDPVPPKRPPVPEVTVPVPVPKPVAHWKLNEGEGSVVEDPIGEGLKGKLRGMSDANWIAAAPQAHGSKAALVFNKPGQWVHMTSHEKLSLESFSVVLWARVDTPSESWQTMLEHDRFGTNWFGLYQRGTPPQFHFRWCKHQCMDAVSKSKVGTWHHVAGTYDRTTQAARIYVDGVMDAQVSGIVPRRRHGPFRLGANLHSGEFFQGALDDVRVYGHALTPSQVRTLMLFPDKEPEGTPVAVATKKENPLPKRPVLSKEQLRQMKRDRVIDEFVESVVSRLQDPKAPLAKVLDETTAGEGEESFTAEARKLLDGVVSKLIGMRAEREKALKAWAGKKVTLPSIGRRAVEVIEISEDRIKVKKFFRLNNETRSREESIALDKLKSVDWKRLYTPSQPEDPVGWAAGLLRGIAAGNVADAGKALDRIKGHELESHMARAVERARSEEQDARAEEAIRSLAEQFKQKRWKPLLSSLQAFDKAFGSTRTAKDRNVDLEKWRATARAEVERIEGLLFDFRTPENAKRFMEVFKKATYRKFKIEPRDSSVVFKRTVNWAFSENHHKKIDDGICLQAPEVRLGTNWELEYRIRLLITSEVVRKEKMKSQSFNVCFVAPGEAITFSGAKNLRVGLSLLARWGGRFTFGLLEPGQGKRHADTCELCKGLNWQGENATPSNLDGTSPRAPTRADGVYHFQARMKGNLLELALNGKKYKVQKLPPKAVELISKSCLSLQFLDARTVKPNESVGEETVLEFFRFRALK